MYDYEMTFAYRILKQQHDLPPDGRPTDATIRIYPEKRKWDETASAYSAATPLAVTTSHGVQTVSTSTKCNQDLTDYHAAGFRLFMKTKRVIVVRLATAKFRSWD
jgi:hypothetical protein